MASGVTEQALARLSHLPESDNPATMIAGQQYDNVEFVGGDISGVDIHDLGSPLAITDGGTGQSTANTALNALLPAQSGNTGKFLKTDGANTAWETFAGSGTVTSVAVTTQNGVSATVTNPTTAASLAFTLGAITPTSVNGVIVSGTSTPTLAVTGTTAVSGTNTGDQTSVTGNAGTATALQNARTIGGVSFNGTANITVASATGGFSVSGGDLALAGSLASTGSRVTKGWFTDIESTNAPTVGGTAATGSGGLVRATSPTLVTPVLGAATATSISFGGTALNAYAEGTYTPTLYNTTNVAASTAYVTNYYRVGNFVTVFGRFDLDPSASGILTELGMSLPVASDFTQVYDTGGNSTSVGSAVSGSDVSLGVVADTTNNRAVFTGTVSDAVNMQHSFQFTYIIK